MHGAKHNRGGPLISHRLDFWSMLVVYDKRSQSTKSSPDLGRLVLFFTRRVVSLRGLWLGWPTHELGPRAPHGAGLGHRPAVLLDDGARLGHHGWHRRLNCRLPVCTPVELRQ